MKEESHTNLGAGRFMTGVFRLLTSAATILLLACSGTGCSTMGNPGGSQQYTLTVRNEYALRLLQPIIRYPDGYEHGGVAMVPPGGEAGFVGVNRPVPPYATLFWIEPDGTIIRAVVDVGQKLGRRATIGEIVFTVQPDRNVVVTWRDFQ